MKSKRKSPRQRRDPNIYPPGWDRKRVEAVIRYYDPKHGEDLLGASPTTPVRHEENVVWVELPGELLPQVKRLISRYRRSA